MASSTLRPLTAGTVGSGVTTYTTPNPVTFGVSYTFSITANNAVGVEMTRGRDDLGIA